MTRKDVVASVFTPVDDIDAQKRRNANEHEHQGRFIDGIYVRNSGMNWFITGLFMIGEIAGGGLVSLPVVTVRTSIWACIGFTAFMAIAMTYTAILIGKCWVILVERYPEYRTHCRKPYPEIALRAFGPAYKHTVSVCIDIAQFGMTVVYVLLSARNICDLLKLFFHVDFSYCFMVVVLAGVLLPATFLKSPEDFWPAVIVAMFTSTFAAAFIISGAVIDHDTCGPQAEMPSFTLDNYLAGIGTFFFAYANHPSFPTLQHDMKVPAQFTRSSLFAFIMVTSLYLPVSVISYYAYGDSVKESIINSIQTPWLQIATNLLITLHCLLTITIASNPINQEAEELLNVPQEFGVKRVVVRTGMMMLVVFAALSVPQFGALMELCGATGNMLTALVFPCLFYLRLKAAEDDQAKEGFVDADQLTWTEIIRRSPKLRAIVCIIVPVTGLFIGVAASYAAVKRLSVTHFVTPCYLRPFIGSNEAPSTTAAVDCCGHFQNLTVFAGVKCTPFEEH